MSPSVSDGPPIENRSRIGGSRRLAIVGASVALGAGLIALVVTTSTGVRAAVGTPVEYAVTSGPASPPAAFLAGDRLTGPGTSGSDALKARPAGGLMGWLSPVGVPSPTGADIAYNAWTYHRPVDPQASFSDQGISDGDPLARPSIRVIDPKTGADTLLQDGAFSLAWRGDGAVAYFKGVDPDLRANQPYLGNVFVRNSFDSAPEAWTTRPDRYVVIAWAGDRLLVYRELEGESLELDVVDGPGQLRTLAVGARLVALSPDGTQVLLNSEGTSVASLVDVATGKELASVDLSKFTDPATGGPLAYIGYGGSWQGDQVVAEAGSSLLLFKVADGKIEVERQIMPQGDFPMGLHEPRFTDPAGTKVVAWAPSASGPESSDPGARVYAYVACGVATDTCAEGPVQDTKTFYAITNPSRPAEGSLGD